MKDSTKDKAAGTVHEMKGAMRAKVGRVVGNPNLEADGSNEKLAGKVQKKLGDVEKVIEK